MTPPPKGPRWTKWKLVEVVDVGKQVLVLPRGVRRFFDSFWLSATRLVLL